MTTVGIVYGGRSVEHGVSINSARNVARFINRQLFQPILMGVSPAGDWFLTPEVMRDMQQGEPLSIELRGISPQFRTTSGRTFSPDVVFPVLHGTDGEDGSVQGLLQVLGIPQVGSGVLGSAVGMNKAMTKRVLRDAGIPVADFRVVHADDRATLSFSDIERTFGLPFMVKAASLGSSVGVSKVKSEAEFSAAVAEAFRYDHTALIEKFIAGREVECAVMGNHPVEASLPGEIEIGKGYDFYTFDAKYVDPEAVRIHVPAPLEPAAAERIRELSCRAYEAVGCQDFARVDLFLTPTGDVWVNEINTIPGFTNASMFPMMWQERGISFTELLTRLIRFAQARVQATARLQRGFTSSLAY